MKLELKKVGVAFSSSICALLLSACSLTKQAAVDPKTINCAFLGSECSNLTPGADGQAKLRYVAPGVQWTTYSKILLEPVTFWAGTKCELSASDQQTLTNYFHQSVYNQLEKKFSMVTQAQPGTIRIQIAIVDAETATPFLRSVSMIIPQAHLLASLSSLATGSYPFVGSAQAELKATDAVTGAVIFEAVDKRVGGGAMRSGFQWSMGDAENAADAWSKEMVTKLSSWTTGASNP